MVTILSLIAQCFRRLSNIKTRIEAQRNSFLWNSFIRTYLETALDSAIGFMIKFYVISFENWHECASSIISIASIILLASSTIFIPIFLVRRQKTLSRSKFTKKYGSLTLDLKTKGFSPKLY